VPSHVHNLNLKLYRDVLNPYVHNERSVRYGTVPYCKVSRRTVRHGLHLVFNNPRGVGEFVFRC
jgi:hypothetical protein